MFGDRWEDWDCSKPIEMIDCIDGKPEWAILETNAVDPDNDLMFDDWNGGNGG